MMQIVACPSCQRHLQIPEDFIGQLVQCPDCQHQFTAGAPVVAVQESKQSGPITAAAPQPEERPRRRRWDEEDDDRRGYDLDDDDDLPRGRRRRGYDQPHRGSLIMTLGILSIFLFPLVLGSIAWIMGNADLRAMREGRMDPAGMSETQTGRTIGAVMVVLQCAMIGVVIVIVFLAMLRHR